MSWLISSFTVRHDLFLRPISCLFISSLFANVVVALGLHTQIISSQKPLSHVTHRVDIQ